MQHYRPLVMSLWGLSLRFWGKHNALPLHILTLALHVANAVLVGRLAKVLSGNMGAFAATALFASFPWTYQVMPSPGSLSKPVALCLILTACLLYYQGRIRDKSYLLWAAVACAVLAPFAYEAAMTVGGYLILTEWILWRRRCVSHPEPRVFLALLAAVPFLLLWRIVPNSYETISFPGWEALFQNSIYFAQALSWPISLLAKPLMQFGGLSDGIATAIVAFSSIILLVFTLKRRAPLTLCFALCWWGLSLGVQWVILPFRYVIDGPRILYAAAAGVALLWAGIIAQSMQQKPLAQGFASLLLLAMTVWGMRFAHRRMLLCEGAINVLEEATQYAIQQNNGPEPLVYVNVPGWVAPNENEFALGHEGYTLVPSYYGTDLTDFIFVNTGYATEATVVGLEDIRKPWIARIGYQGETLSHKDLAPIIRKARSVAITGYEPDRLVLLPVGQVRPKAEQPRDVRATFQQGVILQDLEITPKEDELSIVLAWYIQHQLTVPYTIFVHLYDANGQLVAQADGLPLGGLLPLTACAPGDQIREQRSIRLPTPYPTGTYVVGIGLYRSDTGERMPALDAIGNPLSDSMYREPILLP